MTLSTQTLFNKFLSKINLIETKIPSATVLVNKSKYDTDKQFHQKILQIL